VVTTIAFPRQQRFELRNKMFGFGDAVVKGPGGHPWFKMVRTNASLFGTAFRNCHFSITTMANEPLLSLREEFAWMNYKYELAGDPAFFAPLGPCHFSPPPLLFDFCFALVRLVSSGRLRCRHVCGPHLVAATHRRPVGGWRPAHERAHPLH
jgi:hypothetical protein